ncbi:MAG: L-glutamate gamma-semialdehyde dehydrogenase [candidate division KSB1 bacterium]|nr:L-glutamate gamma-semialdehyde dehydrogenase [candidate division KSB1 bacterium]MDZ7303197.1 L-glutamate gamma-semialdehyde dehydrogenase [candidate division KSB1 bacterium]MDZ7312191.1 L-glutamate gamma-semialdehyde dehydrogenase [candidate division KSB1 bacterium]
MISEFKNTTYLDFSQPANKQAMEQAIKFVESQFSREYALFIDGKEVKTGDLLKSYNPCEKTQVVGTFHKAGKKEVDMAMEAGWRAFESWKNVDPKERAIMLFKAAEIMRRRRLELAAWMIMEASKNWIEADADVAEAIDFLEFYGREMLRYSERQPVTPLPGEYNELVYIPLGVGAVIPPWNFPMAILTGMASAAIVTGNPILLKPASDTPTIGYKLVEIFQEAGLPEGVLNYLPGSGSVIGDYIVAHPKTRFISFTGSMEVGLHINQLAATPQKGQIWIKRVIAEMGGKDAIVVDAEADLAAAVEGVAVSAYGYQGQKCSACSRAIIHEKVYDEFVQRLAERVSKITVGPVKNPANYMGAVISASAQEKIMEYIAIGKKEGQLVIGGEKGPDAGYFIQPTIFKDISPDARIFREEIFGPVLAVTKARDFEQAIKFANDSIYGLTGAVYTRDRYKIEKAKREFHCGNLYINRKCTGAMVGGHPFGGFNMSGTDSKAGGRDYLLLFLQAKAVSEKL